MKTVYILGAGFSIPCGAPSQSKIIEKILSLPQSTKLDDKQKRKIEASVAKFTEFAENNLFTSVSNLSKIALEDIFTPLDKCIIEDISFRDIDPKKLIETRENLYGLIASAISTSISSTSEPYITKFVDYLITQTEVRRRNIKDDKVAVISTNWDIVLDNAIQSKLDSIKKDEEDFAGVLDYCCYISSLKEDKRIKPGLQALGMGKFNVKLLKLHGSMNWLVCPRCQRLYVSYYKNFQGNYILKNHYCRHCQNNFENNRHESTRLRGNLIMPTFLKSLNNFQLKLIWQNAGIELSEADKIVFIGYSLPYADFELRQLLSRMLKRNVEVRVVLTKHDEPQKGFEDHSAGYRYKTFFSSLNPHITYEGVEEYFKKENVSISLL